MVIIRLTRGGAKKRPFYHVVVADSRKPRDGRFIEQLGFYDPINPNESDSLKLDLERVNYWVSNGAQPSERVSHLIKTFSKLQQQIVVAMGKDKEISVEKSVAKESVTEKSEDKAAEVEVKEEAETAAKE